MPATVTLSSKNQVVIPQEARKKLGAGPGEISRLWDEQMVARDRRRAVVE